MGEWCLPNEEYYECVPYLYSDAKSIEVAYNECEQLYKKYLYLLSEKLNEIHQLNYDTKAYNIILGNWLLTYIHQLYQKYNTLSFAYKNYNIDNTYINEAENYIPLDMLDYLHKITDNDEYNFQQFSQIIKLMEFPYTPKQITSKLKQASKYTFRKNNKRCFFNKVVAVINKIFNPKVTITQPYFNNGFIYSIKLYFSKIGFYQFEEFQQSRSLDLSIDTELRKNLILEYSTNFEKILAQMIPQNLPIFFLEAFNEINEMGEVYDNSKTEIYYTSNALNTNNLYKFFLARNHQNIKIVSHQHGGGYGVQQFTFMEYYERTIVEQFYTWGWEEVDAKYLPHPKLITNKTKYKKSDSILLPLTGNPRYLHRFQDQFFSTLNIKYENNIYSFLDQISENTKKYILIRHYPQYYGWALDKKIEKKYPFIQVDNLQADFSTTLSSTKVVIALNLSTTYLEALSRNIPTLIYVDKELYRFRKLSQVHIDKLHDKKIVFYDMASLVEHLEVIYDEIDIWWYRKDIQCTVKDFCDTYAKTSMNWTKNWYLEFNKLLK